MAQSKAPPGLGGEGGNRVCDSEAEHGPGAANGQGDASWRDQYVTLPDDRRVRAGELPGFVAILNDCSLNARLRAYREATSGLLSEVREFRARLLQAADEAREIDNPETARALEDRAAVLTEIAKEAFQGAAWRVANTVATSIERREPSEVARLAVVLEKRKKLEWYRVCTRARFGVTGEGLMFDEVRRLLLKNLPSQLTRLGFAPLGVTAEMVTRATKKTKNPAGFAARIGLDSRAFVYEAKGDKSAYQVAKRAFETMLRDLKSQVP